MENKQILEELRSAFDSAADGILVTDANLVAPGPTIKYVNNAYQKISGYARSELIGQSPRLFQGPETDSKLLSALKAALQAGHGFHGEAINYRRDGTSYWVEWDIAPIRQSDGEITGFISIQRDTTRRKQAEEKLDKALKNLRLSNERQKELTGVLAHDLKSPIAAVHGSLGILQHLDKAILVEKGAELIQGAITRLDLMSAKIDQLVAEAAAADQSAAMVPLRAIVREVLQEFDDQVRQLGGRVRVGFLPDVVGRRTELREIFHNLISNAIKYRHPGRAPQISIVADGTEGGDYADINIIDNGKGISAEFREKVFEAGGRGDNEEGVAGHGYGLSFVKRAMERLGGDITFESKPEQGTTFTLRFPSA